MSRDLPVRSSPIAETASSQRTMLQNFYWACFRGVIVSLVISLIGTFAFVVWIDSMYWDASVLFYVFYGIALFFLALAISVSLHAVTYITREMNSHAGTRLQRDEDKSRHTLEVQRLEGERDQALARSPSDNLFTQPRDLESVGKRYSLDDDRAQYNLTIFRIANGELRDGKIAQINPPARGKYLRLGLCDGLHLTYQVTSRGEITALFNLVVGGVEMERSVRFERQLPDGETFQLGDYLVVVDYDVLTAGCNLHRAKVQGTVWHQELLNRTTLSKGIVSSK